MAQHSRGETRTHTSQSSTSSSIGSELSTTPLNSNIKLVPAAHPPPAYVAVAAASQLVTDNNAPISDSQDKDDYTSPSHSSDNEPALFSPGGLASINAFLDQIFYNFLVVAHSTSLDAIQTAVENVLKGKLAKHAIASANEELQELLSDDADEDLAVAQENITAGSKMDVEAVFWRTRLRIMVYMRLGEMEDEDEENYVEQGQAKLHRSSQPSRKRLSLNTGLVSWAAAIYLTSILEFVAEQCLSIAGQAAFDRVAARRRSKPNSPEQDGGRVVVEEHDVERIALSSTLGRLWRSWRKQLRKPNSRNLSGANKKLSPAKERKDSSPPSNKVLRQSGADDVRRGSAESEEGSRVNAVRLYRLSQRPRSLLIARRINSLDEGLRKHSAPMREHQDAANRRRSQSVPKQPRNAFTSQSDSRSSAPARPSSAPKPPTTPSPNIVLGGNEKRVVDEATEQESGEEVMNEAAGETELIDEKDTSKSETRSENGSAKPGRDSPQSFLDRAAATRSPAAAPVKASRTASEAEATGTTKETDPGSVESLTSIQERHGSVRSVSPQEPLPDSLGIQEARGGRKIAGAGVQQPRMRQNESSKSSLREPMLRQVQSFEREERSSVRRLSESSSKHSKSGGGAQEPASSPYNPGGGQSEHYQKDFQHFMEGQETVKYTLTPKTLQEIEASGSSRYKVKEVAQPVEEPRPRQMSNEALVSAQQAVVAKMNASLKSYGGATGDSPGSENGASNRTGLGQSIGAENGFAGGNAGFRGLGVTAEDMESSGVGRDTMEAKPAYSTYSGWTSTRTSIDSPRRSGANGSSMHQWPATVSSARKTSTSTLEPRDAGKPLVGRGGETAELVAFLRSTGPPSGHGGQQGMLNGNSSYRSNSTKTASMNGSFNSHTGLIMKGSRSPMTNNGHSATSEIMAGSPRSRDTETGPKRTRTRVKDPYALPSDEEEDEDELTALPHRSETLIDFLRNVEPPSHMVQGGSATPRGEKQIRGPAVMSGAADSTASSLQGRAIKNKGSVKSLWKKINP